MSTTYKKHKVLSKNFASRSISTHLEIIQGYMDRIDAGIANLKGPLSEKEKNKTLRIMGLDMLQIRQRIF